MYTFKEHLGNCQGLGVMNLEAKGQRGKLCCQFLGKQRKKNRIQSKVGEKFTTTRDCFMVLCLFLFRLCISKLQPTHRVDHIPFLCASSKDSCPGRV